MEKRDKTEIIFLNSVTEMTASVPQVLLGTLLLLLVTGVCTLLFGCLNLTIFGIYEPWLCFSISLFEALIVTILFKKRYLSFIQITTKKNNQFSKNMDGDVKILLLLNQWSLAVFILMLTALIKVSYIFAVLLVMLIVVSIVGTIRLKNMKKENEKKRESINSSL